MKNIMKSRIILCTMAFTLVFLSCDNDLLNKTNPNNLTTDSYYKTDEDLAKALNGVYALLQSNGLGGREWFFLQDLRSDDVQTGGGQLETPRNQILIGSHAPSNPVLSSVFQNLYRLIHRANALITNAPTATTKDQSLKDRYVAEARVLRAWAYHQLLEFWGGVPLYTTYAIALDETKPRASGQEVSDFLISELSAVTASLPESYSGNDLGRVTKGAAHTLLAKIYLAKGDYTNAKQQLEAVKTIGYNLTDNYFDNFTEENEYNEESIWEISYTSSGNYNWDGDGNDYGPNESWIRSQEYSAIGWRNLIPSDGLLAEFENNDPRLNDNFYFTGDSYGDPAQLKTLTDGDQRGNNVIYQGVPQKVSWKKYSVMYKLDPGGYYDKIGINYRMYRYSDVLLMLAECENEVGSPALAIDYLNEVRNRPSVNMPDYPTAEYPVNSKSEIFRAIVHERRVELAGEEVRNFDILRWRKNRQLASEPISYFQANKYEYLPIPQDEINNNPLVPPSSQNPGY